MFTRPTIEPLEARIAPAALIATNGRSATYTDVDGDHVTVTVSAGTLVMNDFTTVATGLGDQLQNLDLSDAAFANANVTFKVAKVPGGDGLADVGAIDAHGQNLGAVKILGDLGQIDAGAPAGGKAAIKSLTVDSLGRFGLSTQGAGGSLESDIMGVLGSLSVKHDVKEASLEVLGKISKLQIGGSLIGGAANNSGVITASGDITAVKIGGDIQGGTAALTSGGILSQGQVGSVSVSGSIIGGLSGNQSGFIQAISGLTKIAVSGDLQGTAAASSAEIVSNGKIASVAIAGSIRGGQGTNSAHINAADLGAITVGGDLLGGAGTNAGEIAATGSAPAHGKITSVAIGGSAIGNLGAGSASIFSFSDTGSVKIAGSLIGGPASQSGFISCGGTLSDVAIKGSLIGGSSVKGGIVTETGSIVASTLLTKVTIGGNVIGGSSANHSSLGESGMVLGTNTAHTSGSIGTVSIGGSIIAGYIENSSGSSGTFSGGVFAIQDVGKVTVKHDIYGGFVGANGNLAGVKLGGSLVGQTIVGGNGFTNNGFIGAHGTVGPVVVGGDVIGASADGTSMTQSGCIAGGSLKSVTIRGSLIAGTSVNGSMLTFSGAILAQHEAGPISIGKNIVGNATQRVTIIANGPSAEGPASDVAITSITVGGRVEAADILAGYSVVGTSANATNADAQIGAVKIGGSWATSNLVAGAVNSVPPNFGDANDSAIAGGNTAIASKIASLTIGGPVYGTPSTQSSTDHYGFVAQSFGAIKIHGIAVILTSSNSDPLVSATGDVFVHQIA